MVARPIRPSSHPLQKSVAGGKLVVPLIQEVL
jgi:hypothetical protein